jgi:hypothetical protein
MIDQLELYGNAITGFFVVQSIGFAYTLGTSHSFKCLAFSERTLNSGLVAHFIIASVACCIGLHVISKAIQRLSNENSDLVRKVHYGKMVAVVAFAAIPVLILLLYGLNPTSSLEACLSAKPA